MAYLRQLGLLIGRNVLEDGEHGDHVAFDLREIVWEVPSVELVAGGFPPLFKNRIDAVAELDQVLPALEHDAVSATHVDDDIALPHETFGLGDAPVAQISVEGFH